MSVQQGPSPAKPKLVWADAPWTVAALLGVWGVMIGIEEFRLANIVMVLTGLSFTIRLFRDSIETKPRRVPSFIVGVLLIVVGIGVDFHFTKKKQSASEAKAQEIPSLNSQITQLQGTIAKQKTELENRDSKAEQKLTDIQQQNAALQKSVETKDAALIAIAKRQYSLNFLPQLIVAWDEALDDIRFTNEGKTNVTIAGVTFNGLVQSKTNNPAVFISPTATYGVKLSEKAKADMLSQALTTGQSELKVKGSAFVQTLDQRKYEVVFTVHFVIEGGKMSRIFISDNETIPSDWSSFK